jgi:hypothetical protein
MSLPYHVGNGVFGGGAVHRGLAINASGPGTACGLARLGVAYATGGYPGAGPLIWRH